MHIHIGQGGVQFSNALWEQYCFEYFIQPDGNFYEKVVGANLEKSPNRLFKQSTLGKLVPRALLIDSEPTVIGY